jgi:1-deoxy-D-xylulose-5-phosphate reductoisomerase
MIKSLAVLGSTGSIGVQALEVARLHNLKIEALTAGSRVDIIENQIRETFGLEGTPIKFIIRERGKEQ